MVVVLAGYSLIVQDSIVELTVTDGSIDGIIQGDFFETNRNCMIVSYLNATTTAAWQDHRDSNLTMQIRALTYWDEIPISGVKTVLYLTVRGNLDSELSVRSLELAFNQTASHTMLTFLETFAEGVNVSFESVRGLDFSNNGSSVLKADLINRTEASPYYEFSLQSLLHATALGEDNLGTRFMCFKAVLNGNIEPEFSVSISISIVNTSAAS